MVRCKVTGKNVVEHCGKCFKKLVKKEQYEHPWATKKIALRIVLDHKKKGKR